MCSPQEYQAAKRTLDYIEHLKANPQDLVGFAESGLQMVADSVDRTIAIEAAEDLLESLFETVGGNARKLVEEYERSDRLKAQAEWATIPMARFA